MSFTLLKVQAGITCPVELRTAVNDDVAITTVCEEVQIDQGDQITFQFAGAGPLSGPEDTALDALLAVFTCPPDNPNEDEIEHQFGQSQEDDVTVGTHVSYLNFEGDVQVIDEGIIDDSVDTRASKTTVKVGETIGSSDIKGFNDVQEFYATGGGDKFLQINKSRTNEATMLALRDGEVVHLTIDTVKEPTSAAIIKIVLNATDGGAGQLSGGTQVGADIDKTSGSLSQVKLNLSGYTFSAGDRISVYIEKNPDKLYRPLVRLFIKYTG